MIGGKHRKNTWVGTEALIPPWPFVMSSFAAPWCASAPPADFTESGT